MKLATTVWVLGSALVAVSAPTTAAPIDQTKDTTTNAPTQAVVISERGASDQQVRAEVLAQIDERPSLRFFNIVVYASHREVYLKGLVDTTVDRDMASVIAASVPGVKLVHNDLGLNGS